MQSGTEVTVKFMTTIIENRASSLQYTFYKNGHYRKLNFYDVLNCAEKLWYCVYCATGMLFQSFKYDDFLHRKLACQHKIWGYH